jgi:transposase-like protein
MTKSEAKPTIAAVNEQFSKSPDGLREIVRAVMQEMLEAEMTDAVGAEKGERTGARLGYRSGYYMRTLSPASASSSCACRRIATAGSRPSCSNATSARNKP